MRIALFGQAAFAKDVLERLQQADHEIVGVFAPPEGARPDPLAEAAAAQGLALFRHKSFRRRGAARPERVAEHAALGAELNVLAYVTVILPPEIIDAPAHGSLCFHPSLLPKYRGGSAIPWQIILGETETGVTVFRPDAGIDTGPIVVQKGGVSIEPTDTAASLYFDKLYPLGVEAVVEAVARVADGSAEPRAQDESLASHQPLLDEEAARIDWKAPAERIDRLVRGCDPQPGAHATLGGEVVRLFGAIRRLEDADAPPRTVLGPGPEQSLEIALDRGRLQVGRVRIGGGPKRSAAEAGIEAGARLG